MTVHHSSATDPVIRTAELKSMSAGAIGVGAIGSVAGLAISTAALPVVVGF